MKLTIRDVEILVFINECGFCTTNHIEERFNIRVWRIYQIMKRLVNKGLVKQIRIFYGKPNLYYLTNIGAEFSDLDAIDKISLGGYEHQITLTTIIIKLLKKYPTAIWQSERRLKYEKFSDGLGARGHISDGLIILDDGKVVAIEVELSLKSTRRLESILRAYMGQLMISEVWYFCSERVIPVLTKLTEKKPIIKIYSIKDDI